MCICIDKSIFPAFVGAIIGGICSFAGSYLILRKQSKTKKLNDIYSVVAQLSGFIDYCQYLYKFNNLQSDEQASQILNRIREANKNIIDINNSSYYNNDFGSEVRGKINAFLGAYIGWQGFRPLQEIEVLNEVRNINNLQLDAIDVLRVITESDKIPIEMDNRERVYNQCQHMAETLKNITYNLAFLLGESTFKGFLKYQLKKEKIEWYVVEPKLVNKCFRRIMCDNWYGINQTEMGRVLYYNKVKGMICYSDKPVQIVCIDEKEYSLESMVKYFVDIVKER